MSKPKVKIGKYVGKCEHCGFAVMVDYDKGKCPKCKKKQTERTDNEPVQ